MQAEVTNYFDLLQALQKMTEEQLKQSVRVVNGDEDYTIKIASISEIGDDLYVNKEDDEDGGTLDDLKDVHGEDFKEEDYELSTPKTRIFLFAEF